MDNSVYYYNDNGKLLVSTKPIKDMILITPSDDEIKYGVIGKENVEAVKNAIDKEKEKMQILKDLKDFDLMSIRALRDLLKDQSPRLKEIETKAESLRVKLRSIS